ncbi:hypothetical protein RB195_016308 [Necator americanus]|uniref:Uncharacterized protein n=1 Tax=Necator americanus TaxID=51031 RepID=A0ABR1E8P3_NECAM
MNSLLEGKEEETKRTLGEDSEGVGNPENLVAPLASATAAAAMQDDDVPRTLARSLTFIEWSAPVIDRFCWPSFTITYRCFAVFNPRTFSPGSSRTIPTSSLIFELHHRSKNNH